jgi:hypothetical protein
MLTSTIVAFVGLAALAGRPCVAHVGLTFPPARYPDLDFLDNVRTPPPCGVPKGNSEEAPL